MECPAEAYAREHRLNAKNYKTFFTHGDMRYVSARRGAPAPPAAIGRQQRSVGGAKPVSKPVSQDPPLEFSDKVGEQGHNRSGSTGLVGLLQSARAWACPSPSRLACLLSCGHAATGGPPLAERYLQFSTTPQIVDGFKIDYLVNGEEILLRKVQRPDAADSDEDGYKWLPMVALDDLRDVVREQHERALLFKCSKKLYSHVRLGVKALCLN